MRVISTVPLFRATTMLAAPPSMGCISRWMPSRAKKLLRCAIENCSEDTVLIVEGIWP